MIPGPPVPRLLSACVKPGPPVPVPLRLRWGVLVKQGWSGFRGGVWGAKQGWSGYQRVCGCDTWTTPAEVVECVCDTWTTPAWGVECVRETWTTPAWGVECVRETGATRACSEVPEIGSFGEAGVVWVSAGVCGVRSTGGLGISGCVGVIPGPPLPGVLSACVKPGPPLPVPLRLKW